MPSIKRDHSQLAIQVVREYHGRSVHGNKHTTKNATQVQQPSKRNPKPPRQSHRSTERYLSLSSDNGRNLDVSSASSLSTKSAFARLGTQEVATQGGRSLNKVPNVSTDKLLCHSLGNDTRKQVIVEKHSPPRKTISKLVSPSLSKPPTLGSLENVSVFKDNFHSVNNPEIYVPSVQHKQPEIVTVITKEPESFDQQLQHGFEKELVPTSNSDQLENQFTEEMESECCDNKEEEMEPECWDNKEEENHVDSQNQIPAEVFTNVLDSKATNSDLPNGISASKTSPVEDKASVEQLENKSVREDEICVNRQKENANPAEKPEQNACCPCRETASMQKTLSTVAAATAAALSAHPLLTSHNRLEAQLMTLLEKMNSLEQQICLRKHEMEKEEKLQKLENQLSQVKEDRMSTLEFLQKQMIGMQTNFMNVAESFERMFGRVPDNVQQRINENERKTEPLHFQSTQNVQHSKDAEMFKEHDSLESLDFDINMNKDITSYSKSDFVLPEDKRVKNPKKERHIEKTSSKNATRLLQSKETATPFMKPKVNSNNPLIVTNKASNAKTKTMNGNESKSSSKPNKTVSSVNSSSKFQNPRFNKNKKYQSNVQEEKLVVKEANRNIHKPTSVAEKQSVKELPLKYSYLKTFSSNPYSKEPYVVRETSKTKRVPKRQPLPSPAVLNTSYVISSPELQQEKTELNEIENQNRNSKKWFTSSQSVAPLEKYLLDSPLKTQLFTSDKIYAGLKSVAPSAELIAGQEILQHAQTSRMFLEENLKNLERDYEKDAVYNIVDNLYQNSPASQTYQMKRKVDQCIAKMQLDIQKELSMEEATSNKLSCSNPATKVNKLAKKKDSEGLNGSRQKQLKVVVKMNEKPPQSSNKNLNSLYQDQEYLTQVFGKATYQNKRTTIREPYLHIRNKPQTKVTQPKAMVDVKGIQKKSAKIQTVEEEEAKKTVEKGTEIMANDKKYFFASKPNNDCGYLQNSSLVPGHLGYMAVSLREPRMDFGLTHAVTVRPGSSMVIAPQDQPKVVPAGNVVLCNIPFVDEAKPPAKKPILSKQDLPSVDIAGKLTEEKVVKNVNFITDNREKNVQNTSVEKLVTITESTDKEDEVPCEKSGEGSDIIETENDVEVVVVNSKAKETSESLANSNNSNQIVAQQLQLLTGLTSELMLTKSHKLAATLATSQRMPIDAESIQQEEDLNEIIQLVEQELLSQIISGDQVKPNSEVDHLKKNSSAEKDVKPSIPKTRDSVTEDSLIMSQLIEEILADKVGTILENDYTSNIPTSEKHSIPISSNQLKKGEICQTKLNESSPSKQDAVCQTSVLSLNELVLEDNDSHCANKMPENTIISQPLQHTSAKEPVPVDSTIPSEIKAMINQEGSSSFINDEAANYSTNEDKSLKLNKNSVEQQEKTGGDPDEIPMEIFSQEFVEDSNRDAVKDISENTMQPVMEFAENIMSHSNDSTMQNTNVATKQTSKSQVQPTSRFVMQPTTSKIQDTNATVTQRCISVVARDYNKDTMNILGNNNNNTRLRQQSEAERAEVVQRKRREATLAKLRIDKMQSIYIPPDSRVRSPVRHVKLVEITSKSLNETKDEEEDQFMTPSLPAQLHPSQSTPPPSPLQSPPPQLPTSQLPPQPPVSHKTATSQTSSSHATPPLPSSIIHFQTSGAGKGPRSLFSPEKLESPEKITDEQVKEIEESSMTVPFEGLNLVPKFDADNDNNEEEILGTDNEVVSDSSPSSDKMSSESLSSGSGSSNTAFESLSDGQWLLSQSEGQAAVYMVSDSVYKRILANVSNTSTLKDSNELTRGDIAENTYSDGEFVLQQRVPPEQDPVLQLVLKMEKSTLNPPHIPEMIPSNADADADGQRSPGELVLSCSEIGQTTFETSSDYVAAASTNVKLENFNKMSKSVLPQQSSSSKQPHIHSSDKGKTNSRVIFVGLTDNKEVSASESELGFGTQQDQTPVAQNPVRNGSFQPKAPITTAGHLLPVQQSFLQPTDQSWSKSVHFSQYYGIEPIVSDSVSYNGSQHIDASVESDIHKTLSGDSNDIKDAQSLPRPPLIPHRIPVTIPSPGEIWDDEDIEEISFQDGI